LSVDIIGPDIIHTSECIGKGLITIHLVSHINWKQYLSLLFRQSQNNHGWQQPARTVLRITDSRYWFIMLSWTEEQRKTTVCITQTSHHRQIIRA